MLPLPCRTPSTDQQTSPYEVDGVDAVTYSITRKTLRSQEVQRKGSLVGVFNVSLQTHEWIGRPCYPQGALLCRSLAELVSKTLNFVILLRFVLSDDNAQLLSQSSIRILRDGKPSCLQVFITGFRPSSCRDDTEKNGRIGRINTSKFG